MPPVPFAIQAYQARAKPFSAQRCVNYFAEFGPEVGEAKSPAVLYNAPGIKEFGTARLQGEARGAWVMTGVLYMVFGNEVYSIASDGAATLLGTITSSTGRVGMASNRATPNELIIVDGASGWTYDTSNGLREITDPDFQPASTVAFQDGYFVLFGDNFFLSGLDDGRTYIATDFANAEGDPDNIVAGFSNHRELWVFGEETIEVYFNSGATDFPFERIEGAFIERGCAAAFSIAEDDNTLFWLAEDRIIYRAEGYRPRRISTHAIEEEIRLMADVSDAYAFFMTLAGHKFYSITFPTGGRSFVYDIATSLWHERESFNLRHWRVATYAFAYGKHIIGDAFSGRLGELDLDTYTEYDTVMQGILISPSIHSDRKRVKHKLLEIDIESGTGSTGEVVPPSSPTLKHVLYTRFDGVDGAKTALDESASAHVMTFNNNVEIDTAQSKFGGASLFLNGGTGDYVSIPDSDDFHFTAEFTVHGWIRPTFTGVFKIIAAQWITGGQLSWQIALNNTDQLRVNLSTNGTTSTQLAGGTVEMDKWSHFALTRDASDNARIFVNGTLVAGPTLVSGALHNSTDEVRIGLHSGSPYSGHIDQLEIINGEALWTANFTAPQGVEPKIPEMWLDWSDDGGRTWSLRKPVQSMGDLGNYKTRLRWLRMGAPRNRIYRLTTADPVKRSIINAHLEAEELAH